MTFVTSGARRLLGTMTGSMSDRASRSFRITALLMTVLLAVPQTADMVAAGGGGVRSAVLGGIGFILALGFALAFWRITGLKPGRVPRWANALITLQAIATIALVIDLLPVVAAEVGYVLPPRSAWRWFAVLIALMLLLAGAAVSDGSFEPATGLTHLPFAAQATATVIQLAGWSLFAFIAGRFLACEREEREEYARLNAELGATRELLAQTSRSGERLRIARELHDTLGHHLTAMAVNLDLAARVDGEQAREIVRRSHMLSKLLLNDVRDTVSTMRGEKTIDLEQALRAIVCQVPTVEVDLTVDAELNVSADQAHALLRSVQEALTNAVRHGRARRFSVVMRQDGETVDVTMHNDGAAAERVVPGNGLLGMRERITRLGGTLEFGADPTAGGFFVHAVLPLGDRAA